MTEITLKDGKRRTVAEAKELWLELNEIFGTPPAPYPVPSPYYPPLPCLPFWHIPFEYHPYEVICEVETEIPTIMNSGTTCEVVTTNSPYVKTTMEIHSDPVLVKFD